MVLNSKKLCLILLLSILFVFTIQPTNAAEYVYKEPFDAQGSWTFQAGTVITDGLLTADSTSLKPAAYIALPEAFASNTEWRFNARIHTTADPATTGKGYFGLTDDPAGTWSGGAQHWIAMGVSGSTGITAMCNDATTTLLVFSDIQASTYYNFEIVGTPDNVSFAVSYDNGTLINMVKTANPGITFRNTFVKFNVNGDQNGFGCDRIALMNYFDGYNDATYNIPMRYYTQPASDGQYSLIELPASYDRNQSYRVVIACHPNTGSSTSFVNASLHEELSQVRASLVAANYIFAASDSHISNWGNTVGATDSHNLLEYLDTNFNLTVKRAYVFGSSMGGIAAANYALQYPGEVVCMALIYPVLNLDDNYYALNGSNNYASTINTAYGCNAGTYAAITDGHNPVNETFVLKNYRTKIWHGDSDTTVNDAQSKLYVSNIQADGGNITLVSIPGANHGASACFDYPGIVAFFNGMDPELPVIQFTIASSAATVTEADTTITLTVTKTGTIDHSVGVDISTIPDTASSPDDYTAISDTLTFNNTTSIEYVTLSIKDNGLGTFPKTFKVALSNATGNATLGTPHELTITIIEGNLVQRNTQIKGITSTMNMLWLIPLIIIAMFIINAFMGEGIDMDSMVSVGILVVGIIATIVIAYVIVGNMVL